MPTISFDGLLIVAAAALAAPLALFTVVAVPLVDPTPVADCARHTPDHGRVIA